MNILICYRRTTARDLARALRQHLRPFAGELFLDEMDHRAAEQWRPKWREALRRARKEDTSVLVLLDLEMLATRPGDDVCHMEIQEAYEAGVRVVFLEACIPGRDLFADLVAEYNKTGRPGLDALEAARAQHRELVSADFEAFARLDKGTQAAVRRAAWKAVFDGYVATFVEARRRACEWASQLASDCLSGTEDLQPLNREDLYGDVSEARSRVVSRALIGPSGTGKSHLLARWILHATAGEALAPYVVLVAPEDAARGVEALCGMLGIPEAADRLREMGYSSVSEVLAAFFERLSENDQSRGLVVVVDSLERAGDLEATLKLLQTLCALPHVAAWVTCRQSAWVRYEAALDIDTKPIAEVADVVASRALASRGIVAGVRQLPAFVRRAVNLDIFCFLHDRRVLRDVPSTEWQLLQHYLDFAVQVSPAERPLTEQDVRSYVESIADKQVATHSVRAPAQGIGRASRPSLALQHLRDHARILRVDRRVDGQDTVRLRHDRLDGHNLASWCVQRFTERLDPILETAPSALGLLALGGLYRHLLDRGTSAPRWVSKRRRLFERFLWILDRKAFAGRNVESVPPDEKSRINAAAWTVTYVLQEDHERALEDIREALRGELAESLQENDFGGRDRASRYDGDGPGATTLDAAVSLASVYRPGRGLPVIDVKHTDTVDVFAGWIFDKACRGKKQRFRFVEALSRFDDERDSSIAVFRRLFEQGLSGDVELVKPLASSVSARDDAEARYIREQLLTLVRARGFVAGAEGEMVERLEFLRWFVENEIGSGSGGSDAVVLGALRLQDAHGRKSDWTDIEAGFDVLRRLAANAPGRDFTPEVVAAALSMLGHEHQRVRESATHALPLLFGSRRARAGLLSLVSRFSVGTQWIHRIDEALRVAALTAPAAKPGIVAAFLCEAEASPGFARAWPDLSGARHALHERHESLVTPGAIEVHRFDVGGAAQMRLDAGDETFVLDERARELIARHPSADPGPEKEPKFLLAGLGHGALRIRRSEWGAARRFFAAVGAERAELETRLDVTPPAEVDEWLALVDRRANLLAIAEQLSRGETLTPALLCLHVVVRTRPLAHGERDGGAAVPSLVLAKRSGHSAFYAEATTVGFEEQLTAADLPDRGDAAEWIARGVARGVVEEYGLRNVPELARPVNQLVAGTTLRSLVVESGILNLALVATLELPWSRTEFQQVLTSRPTEDVDDDAEELSRIEFCPLSGHDLDRLMSEVEQDRAGAFHPTSALRLRLARRTWLAG